MRALFGTRDYVPDADHFPAGWEHSWALYTRLVVDYPDLGRACNELARFTNLAAVAGDTVAEEFWTRRQLILERWIVGESVWLDRMGTDAGVSPAPRALPSFAGKAPRGKPAHGGGGALDRTSEQDCVRAARAVGLELR
jgi:hypothetical protein